MRPHEERQSATARLTGGQRDHILLGARTLSWRNDCSANLRHPVRPKELTQGLTVRFGGKHQSREHFGTRESVPFASFDGSPHQTIQAHVDWGWPVDACRPAVGVTNQVVEGDVAWVLPGHGLVMVRSFDYIVDIYIDC